jgi:hydrogenase maturation factor
MQIANLIVEYQPLLKERKWFLGKPIKRRIFWFKSILPKLKVGDFVSFHWDLVLEKLSETDLRNLKKYTELSVQTANFIKKY